MGRSGSAFTGTIKRIVAAKGFGFIEDDDTGTERFFHMSATKGVRFEELREGDQVRYNAQDGVKGPRAEQVERR